MKIHVISSCDVSDLHDRRTLYTVDFLDESPVLNIVGTFDVMRIHHKDKDDLFYVMEPEPDWLLPIHKYIIIEHIKKSEKKCNATAL